VVQRVREEERIKLQLFNLEFTGQREISMSP
jgi:hypothetical protein